MVIDESNLKKIIDARFIKKLANIYIDKKLNRTELLRQATSLLAKNEYMPSNPEFVIDVNKGKGVMRYVPAFTPLDYVIYFYCVLSIDDYLAKTKIRRNIRWVFYGWRLAKSRDSRKRLTRSRHHQIRTPFNPYAYIQHYGEYNAEIKKRLLEIDDCNIIELDIANFYDHIRLDLLENLIRQAVDSSEEPQINLLFHFLKNWK